MGQPLCYLYLENELNKFSHIIRSSMGLFSFWVLSFFYLF